MMKKIRIILWSILILFFAVLSYLTFGHYSEGARAGTLVKLSKKGFIFSTEEGELNTQMFIDESSSASGVGFKVWEFSVTNDEVLLKEMNQALLDGHRVSLKYKERYFKLPWIGDTKYVVYDLEKLK